MLPASYGFDPYRLARNRVKKILREGLLVASHRTLEVKLSERGPFQMQQACPPHIVNHAISQLFGFGDIRLVAAPHKPHLPQSPCSLIALSTYSDAQLEEALKRRISLEVLYREHAQRARGRVDTIGRAAETAVHIAFERSARFIVGLNWGDIKDPRIVGAADGIIYFPSLPPLRSALLVEVKNWREWIYFDSWELWKHIKNAYAIDAVPVFFARRIYGHTFDYVFKRVGALGIETRTQFAPPSMAQVLADVARPDGLDYFDLRFTDQPGPRFTRRVLGLANHVEAARARLDVARPVVEPFLHDLSDERIRGLARTKLYWQLQAALNAANIAPISLEPKIP